MGIQEKIKHKSATMKKILIVIFFATLILSCNRNETLNKIDNIKSIGNKEPRLAAKMLDSLYADIKDESTYTKMKYDLLKVRLNDKNDITPTSDHLIKTIVKYFNSNGSTAERQEAYYYAGSTYRDLDDSPRAIYNFNKSIEIAACNDNCDSVLLRNAYSNLYYLFANVQDYKNALANAQREYALSQALNSMTINTIMHMANAYVDIDNFHSANMYIDKAYNYIQNHNDTTSNSFLFLLLHNCSSIGLKEKALNCYNLIKSRDIKRNDSYTNLVLGKYYSLINIPDSAISSYLKVMEDKQNEYSMYDASKELFYLYSKRNNLLQACKYSAIFITLTEKLDLAKNQELAATVNNKYQYHLDKNRMTKAEHERTLYYRVSIGSIIFIVFLSLVFTIFYIKKKNTALKKQLALSETLAQANQRLAEKTQQSQSLLQMLHKTEMEENAADVVAGINEAADGKRLLSTSEWKQLYSTVDRLHPGFHTALLRHMGKLSEQQMQVCYLMRIGMKNPQIKNATGLPRTTIWRWANTYGDWINQQKLSAQ